VSSCLHFQSDARYRADQFTIHDDAKRNHVFGLIGDDIESNHQLTVGMVGKYPYEELLDFITCRGAAAAEKPFISTTVVDVLTVP
jgi:hypothetical protein